MDGACKPLEGRHVHPLVDHGDAAQPIIERHIYLKVGQAPPLRLPRHTTANVKLHFFHCEQVVHLILPRFWQYQGGLHRTKSTALSATHVIHDLVITVPDFPGGLPRLLRVPATTIGVEEHIALRIRDNSAAFKGFHCATRHLYRGSSGKVQPGSCTEVPNGTCILGREQQWGQQKKAE